MTFRLSSFRSLEGRLGDRTLIMVAGLVAVVQGGCSKAINALSYRDAAQAVDTPESPSDTEPAKDSAVIPVLRACPVLPGGPLPLRPSPSPMQAGYQHDELSGFIHFGLETFDGTEQGDSTVDVPTLFNPTDLDASQWVRVFKNAGFKQVTLTVKHGTGFCLWPSAHTPYSVKNSPWKGGQGDVVREFTDAAHAIGMRIGFYLTPWDQNYPSSLSKYEPYFRNLLTELLTNYGTVDEIEFDGYRAPKPTDFDWKGVVQLAKKLQPEILVWMGPEIAVEGTDIRWVGNQDGTSKRTTSSVGPIREGDTTSVWYPSEAPVSIRKPAWFWHPADKLLPLKTLQAIYFETVGMNTPLRLNVPPSTTGRIEAAEVSLMADFGAWIADLTKHNLAKGQPVTADSTWADGWSADKAVDGDGCTSWAAAKDRTSGRLTIAPANPVTFKLISVSEPIELGERTTAYHVEIKQNGVWDTAPLDASGKPVKGSVIGQRQLWQLNATTAEAVALVIDAARDVPAVAELGLF